MIANSIFHPLFQLFKIRFISSTLFSCQGKSSNSPSADTQGIFEFPSDRLSSEEFDIPDYLNEEAFLCNGKVLKVANCISNQLKKGICSAIIKLEKRVYAIEISCESVKKNSRDTVKTMM